MLQKRLRTATLSTAGSTFARFIYSAPLIAVIATSYAVTTGQGAPQIVPAYWGYVAVGGLAQILATMCIVALFTHRNFAVGITFKKTEVLLSVMIGLLILGEAITWLAFGAILIGLAGVLLLSDPPAAIGAWHKRILNRAAGLGLASGLMFAMAGVAYRGASLSLGAGDVFYRASVSLAFVTTFQLIIMAIWLTLRERGEIGRVLRAWRIAGLVGLTSMVGSACWFVAFTMQTVGLVNGLGQIELLFSIVVGWWAFGETISRREWQGLVLLGLSIVTLVLVT